MYYSDSESSMEEGPPPVCRYHNTQKGCHRNVCRFFHPDLGPACRFFWHTDRGCRHGPDCDFSHQGCECLGNCGSKRHRSPSPAPAPPPAPPPASPPAPPPAPPPKKYLANLDNQTSRKENKENDGKWDSDKDYEEGNKNGKLKNRNGDMKNKSSEVKKKKRSDVKGADKTSETSGKHGRIPCEFIKGRNGVTCGSCGETVALNNSSPRRALQQHYRENLDHRTHAHFFYKRVTRLWFGWGNEKWRAICMACQKDFPEMSELLQHMKSSIQSDSHPQYSKHDHFVNKFVMRFVERDLGLIENEDELEHWLTTMVSSVQLKEEFDRLDDSVFREKMELLEQGKVSHAVWSDRQKEEEKEEKAKLGDEGKSRYSTGQPGGGDDDGDDDGATDDDSDDDDRCNRMGFSQEEFNMLLCYGIKPWDDFDEALQVVHLGLI